MIDSTAIFKPGDPEPEGYLAWHEWASVQHKAGLRQKRCCGCSRWFFPQGLSDKVHHGTAYNSKGEKILYSAPICRECAKEK